MKRKFHILSMVVFVLLTNLCHMAYAKTYPLYLYGMRQQIISGKVVSSADRSPLVGVNILVKGTGERTVTDQAGNFSLKTSAKNPVLIISITGYVRQIIDVKGAAAVNIMLQPVVNELHELVVVGYGVQSKADLTGAITGIKANEIEKSANPDLLGSLQGKMAGVQINSQSGEPGSEMNIQIRGANSLYGSSTPLFVVDGIPFDVNSDEMATASESNLGNSANPLSSINPADIESIDVLKDASATAIYGSRGANGVVIITTKSGKAGKSNITYNGYTSLSYASRKLDLLNGSEWIDYQRLTRPQSALFYEIKDGLIDLDSPVDPFRYPQKDWQDEALRTAITQNHALSFSGGNTQTTFAGGLAYLEQEGIVRSNDMERYSLRLKLDHNHSKKLKLGINLLGSYQNVSGASNGGLPNSANGTIQRIIMTKPVEFFDPATEDDITRYISPTSMLDDAYKNTDLIRATANGYAEYKFTNNLTLNASAGGILTSSKGKEFYSKYTTMGNLNNGVAVLQERRSQTWNSTTRLNYLKTYNRIHKIDLMAAFEISHYNYEYQNMRGVDFIDESTGIDDISKASMISGIKSTRWANNRLSWLARANYSLLFKYLFTASFRVDGSDKFGASNRYGYFPSLAFAWQIHKEKFMKPLTFIDELKMRLSYGQTGNERIPAYQYYSEMSNAYYASGGSNLFGMEPSSRANPDLKWENTVQYNAGLDIGIFKNRLKISADYYTKQTRDMLLPAYIASESGYEQQWKNIGRVDNSGFELQITSVNISGKNFSWSTNFNISTNKNVVKNLGGIEFIPVIMSNGTISNLGRVNVGHAIGTGYGYIRDGVYQIDDFTWQNNSDPAISHASRQYVLKPDVPSVAGATVKPGTHKFRDLNGDLIINDEYDRTFISRSLPKHFGGIGNTFTYKNIEMSAFLEWSYGKQIINLGKRLIEGPGGGAWNISSDFWYNRWTPENPTNGYADFLINNATAGMMSSYYVEDGSYLRLQNISIAYNFPKKLTGRTGISNVQLYANANNLFVWTNYSGFDPDVSYNDPLLTGLDRLAYPRSRSLIFGLKFSL